MHSFKDYMFEKYDKSALMVLLPSDKKILEVQSHIPKGILVDKTTDDRAVVNGLQIDFHITLLYGVFGSQFFPKRGSLGKILDEYKDLSVNVSKMGMFEEKEQDRYALYLYGDNPELEELHVKLKGLFSIEHGFNEYVPHITLAYTTEPFVVSDFKPFAINIDRFVFSNEYGKYVTL